MMKSFRGFMAEALTLTNLPVVMRAQDALPQADPSFTGTTDIDVRKSSPAWPTEATARKQAPNIVLILIDDIGFGATSTFGGFAATPNYDRLAKAGASL